MLTELASPAALFAAAIFLIAASAKLQSRSSTRSAVEGFGLPTVVAFLLAPVELITAFALLLRPRVGASIAIVLLTMFTTVVVRTLRRGISVRCGCFGGSDQRPVGVETIIRNVFLLALVLIPLSTPGTIMRPTLPATLVIGTGTVSAMLVIAIVQLSRDVGTVFGQRLSSVGEPS